MADITRTAEADSITKADLAELGNVTGPAVSIYMPTARGGAEVRENPIRAKALIKDAEAGLKANGASEEAAAEILGPLVALLEDHEFWRYLADGLAMYAAEGFWRAYRLTIDFPEVAYVSDRLAVLPVVSAGMHQDDFLLLALSQNRVRLFEATFATMREIDLGSIPASIEDISGETTPPPHQQQHFGAGGGGVMHSHGTGAEVGGVQLDKFLRQVAQGLGEVLEPNDRRPVVVAAVAEYLPTLREHLTYPHLLGEAVAGNPDTSRPDELHERAWAIVHPALRARSEADAERFGDAIGAGRALAGGGSDILHAARDGRVDTLLLTRRRCTADHGPDDLDSAVGRVLATSGTVLVVDTLPKDVAEGAILRF
ncbi:hypothetical protein [Dietzia aurantiaca]|uniref:Uncharacterized protein n=1 Tax=Dietzia aurantiaca TaxID=983873 RepID=A0ABV9PSC1_9ACTN